MLLLATSFLAGILTVLAPCVLPLLPIIIGSGVQNNGRKSIFILIGSLSVSIIIFTLVLRASTLLIDIPQSFWAYLSGTILIFFGVITLMPHLWEKMSGKFNSNSKGLLQTAADKKGMKREVFIGAALGPVFTSCSPTYSLILATVLPASFIQGVFYILVYVAGLATVLLAIAFLGQKFTQKLKVTADPNGKFKKILGWIFLMVGLSIIFGWDKAIEAYIIERGYFGVTSLEEGLVESLK